ncbi:MAG: NfeD family protein [Porphyromonas sp.]|nr:NfeD family protein [Porphyromonas sp.]
MDLTFVVVAWQWWLIVAILLFVLEIFTPGFVLACFGVAAIGGMLASLLGLEVWVQVSVFSIFAILCLIYLRPFIRRISKRNIHTSTGAEALIGRRVKVTETIATDSDRGRVAVDGDSWRAKTLDGTSVEVGAEVEIVGRESTILLVRQ